MRQQSAISVASSSTRQTPNPSQFTNLDHFDMQSSITLMDKQFPKFMDDINSFIQQSRAFIQNAREQRSEKKMSTIDQRSDRFQDVYRAEPRDHVDFQNVQSKQISQFERDFDNAFKAQTTNEDEPINEGGYQFQIKDRQNIQQKSQPEPDITNFRNEYEDLP